MTGRRATALLMVATLAAAAGLSGCAQGGGSGEPVAMTAAEVVGTWSGPGGSSVGLDADGSAVLVSVPGASADGDVGEACASDFISLISGGAWSLDAKARAVHIVGAESPVPVEISVVLELSDDGHTLTGLFCDGGVVAEWAFVPADAVA